MKPVSIFFFLVILTFLFAIDFYAFRGLKLFCSDLNYITKNIVYSIYWLVYLIIVFLTMFIYFKQSKIFETNLYYNIVYPLAGLVITSLVTKLVFIVFLLFSDIIRLIQLITPNLILIKQISIYTLYIGTAFSLLIMSSFIYGIIYGRFHYQINHIPVQSSQIPAGFNCFKIVHISDWHIGSYLNHKQRVTDVVELINRQQPDLIVFTGDIVNNVATELKPFISELTKLSAPYGKFAVLGNHDYGEYVKWNSDFDKNKNLEELKESIQQTGFCLLNNEARQIIIKDDTINIVGVENWGLPPFPQYGDLDEATKNINTSNFTILLSHDPTHWSEKILPETNLNLTLSGHTHGMQFGIDIPWLKWSPVKFKYPLWRGLYNKNNQYLYVNKGIGFIGFPGRVGMRPEIAVFTLKGSK